MSGGGQTAAVGSPLPAPVVFRVADEQGGIPGVEVVLAVTSEGGGFVTPARRTSDASGLVSVVWTLGTRIGPQSLRATAGGLPPTSAAAQALRGPAALVAPVSTVSQFVAVGRLVPDTPIARVTDAFGNPVPGVLVTFRVGAGQSVLTGEAQASDALGQARLGSWQIGTAAGTYSVFAEIASGASTFFTVTGIPTAFTAADGSGQTANAGTQVPVAPTVLATADGGQPVPGVTVSFSIAGGGGRIVGTSFATTGPDGRASLPGWVLGVTPGANQLSASTLGLDPISFTATGVAATPAQLAPSGSTTFSTFFGNFIEGTAAVRVLDGQGQPVAGQQVLYEVVDGGGLLAGQTPVTDFQGFARLGAWRLGPAAPSQSIRATSSSLPPVVFTATASAVPPSAFNIEVRFTGPTPTQTQQSAFTAAAARWQQIILGDLFDIDFTTQPQPQTDCHPAISNETIDDLVIYAEIGPIDGAGGILGQAGPCIIRELDRGELSWFTVVGRMRFDQADLANLEANGLLEATILHEMAHALGFGPLWFPFDGGRGLDLVTGAASSDPFFHGPSARGAFLAAVNPGSVFTGNPVPVENAFGQGTNLVHWREATFDNELMTGIIDLGVNPLSAFTIASLRDMGYLVNDAVAEPFLFQAAPQAFPAAPGFLLVEAPLPGDILTVDARGRVVRRIPRR